MDFLDDDSDIETISVQIDEQLIGDSSLEPTLSVREINEAISMSIEDAFPREIWVKGEIQRLNFHSSGHIYFNLVDTGSKGSSASTIAVSIFKWNAGKIKGNLREILAEDRQVRLRVKPNFYAPYGKMSLVVSDVDTAFSMGQIAIARRELLEKLNKEGFLRSNAQTSLDELPLKIALVTALDSAAYHDVTDQLKSSGFGFSIQVVNALMQGADSASSVTTALKVANSLDVDVVLLCRGGGAKSDLSSFDTEVVARGICSMSVPVITGLGHQIDVSVADMVAHSSFKTPTASAQFLIERVRDSIDKVEEVLQEISSKVNERLVAAETRLAFISQRLSDSNSVLEKATLLIDSHRKSLAYSAKSNLDFTKQQLASWSQLISAHDPQRVLERGYSLTLNANGALIDSVTSIDVGDELITRVKDGELTSKLIKTKENK